MTTKTRVRKSAGKRASAKGTRKPATIKSKAAAPTRRPRLELLPRTDHRTPEQRAAAAIAGIPAAASAVLTLFEVMRRRGSIKGDERLYPAHAQSWEEERCAAFDSLRAILKHFDRSNVDWLGSDEAHKARDSAPDLFDIATLAMQDIAEVPYTVGGSISGGCRAELLEQLEGRARALQSLVFATQTRPPTDPWGDTSGLADGTVRAIKWLYDNRPKAASAAAIADYTGQEGHGRNLADNLRNAAKRLFQNGSCIDLRREQTSRAAARSWKAWKCAPHRS